MVIINASYQNFSGANLENDEVLSVFLLNKEL